MTLSRKLSIRKNMFCPMQGMAAMFKKSSAKVQSRKNKQHIYIWKGQEEDKEEETKSLKTDS